MFKQVIKHKFTKYHQFLLIKSRNYITLPTLPTGYQISGFLTFVFGIGLISGYFIHEKIYYAHRMEGEKVSKSELDAHEN